MTDWISCRDRLPSIIDLVWIAGIDGFRYVTFGYRQADGEWEDRWHIGRDGNPTIVYGVTHWQPVEIPGPPEPEPEQ